MVMGFEIKLNPVEDEDGETRETQVIIVKTGGVDVEIDSATVDFDSGLLDKIPEDAVNENDGKIEVSEIPNEELIREVLEEAGLL